MASCESNLQEAQLLQGLQHPNVVRCIDVFAYRGYLCMVGGKEDMTPFGRSCVGALVLGGPVLASLPVLILHPLGITTILQVAVSILHWTHLSAWSEHVRQFQFLVPRRKSSAEHQFKHCVLPFGIRRCRTCGNAAEYIDPCMKVSQFAGLFL